MSINDFIRPELMILVPVMYLIGVAIKKSPVLDYWIPFILGGVAIIIAAIYVLATSFMATWHIRVSTTEQNTIRQEVLMTELGVEQSI